MNFLFPLHVMPNGQTAASLEAIALHEVLVAHSDAKPFTSHRNAGIRVYLEGDFEPALAAVKAHFADVVIRRQKDGFSVSRTRSLVADLATLDEAWLAMLPEHGRDHAFLRHAILNHETTNAHRANGSLR